MSRSLVIIAASGLAREVAATVRAGGEHHVVAVLDDDLRRVGTRFGSWTIAGTSRDAVDHPECSFVVCAGSGSARAAIVRRVVAGGVEPSRFATIVDPSVRIPQGCTVGAGSVILAGSVLTADVTVGAHVVVMPHVVLTHDCTVDDYVTLCAGTVLGGGVHVQSGAYLGMNSSVRENLTVGRDSVLGMAAVAVSDVPPGETRVGCPAVPMTGAGAA